MGIALPSALLGHSPFQTLCIDRDPLWDPAAVLLRVCIRHGMKQSHCYSLGCKCMWQDMMKPSTLFLFLPLSFNCIDFRFAFRQMSILPNYILRKHTSTLNVFSSVLKREIYSVVSVKKNLSFRLLSQIHGGFHFKCIISYNFLLLNW